MKKLVASILVTVVLGYFWTACTAAVSPQPAPVEKGPAPIVKTGAEQQWENILALGRREGVVTVYSSWAPETRLGVGQAFREKYGINLELSPFSSIAEIISKALAEKRNGIYLADVFGTGVTLVMSKNEGFMRPLPPELVLPEVLDTKAWVGGKLPLVDKEGLAFSMTGVVQRTLVYNTDLVKERELTGYKDLLKPQYKGKLTLHDPQVIGAGSSMLAHIGTNLWGEAETVDFLTRLLKEQGLVIQRDYGTHMESVVRGKYAIALAPKTDLVPRYIEMGAPVRIAPLEDETLLVASSGGIALPLVSPHPNATKVFVNWLLTREGQSVFAKASANPSTRLDASSEGIDPLLVPVAGKKYYGDTEELMAARSKWIQLSRKIIGESTK